MTKVRMEEEGRKKFKRQSGFMGQQRKELEGLGEEVFRLVEENCGSCCDDDDQQGKVNENENGNGNGKMKIKDMKREY